MEGKVAFWVRISANAWFSIPVDGIMRQRKKRMAVFHGGSGIEPLKTKNREPLPAIENLRTF